MMLVMPVSLEIDYTERTAKELEMKLYLVDKVIKKLIGILETVGNLVNSLPAKDEKRRVRQSPLLKAKMWEKDDSKKAPIKKPSAKGNSRRKGNRDAATQVFNHPRKDYHV